ncbi:MAG: adenylyltransferase/cytidyltransferase family protein [Anaerolineae bacterium]
MSHSANPKISYAEHCATKVLPLENLLTQIQKMKKEGATVATLNGSFDLLHAGHLEMIYQASLQADILIVALNTDRSIQEYKNPSRPIVSLEMRLQMMAAVGFVDFVTWFDETDPRQLLAKIAPDVHVNGAEYGENCIEAEIVKAQGGRIHIVPLVPGLSTSALLEKIKRLAL